MRFGRRRFKKGGTAQWVTAGLAAAVLLVLLATTAAAHTTTVTQSSPAGGSTVTESPAQVTAQFTEELDTKQSVMQVFDAGGKQVSEGNGKVDLNDPDHKTMIATLSAALPAGAYTVKWHVFLTDGDDSSGAFGFIMGTAAPAAQATTAPTAQATAAATAAPTDAPTAAATAAPAAAQAQSTPEGPQALPATGGDASPAIWVLLAGLAAVALAGILVGLARPGAR